MKSIIIVGLLVSLSGCGLNLKHTQVDEAPAGGYQTSHHTVVITYDTEPSCVGTCK